MLKKFLLLVAIFMSLVTLSYAQIISGGMYTKPELPLPQDQFNCQTMKLSDSDLAIKARAESYRTQGNLDAAVAELKKISNEWASHWFLSYLFESSLKLKEALGEVEWLTSKNQCRQLQTSLEYRKENIEKVIKGLEVWDNKWDIPVKDQKTQFLDPSL